MVFCISPVARVFSQVSDEIEVLVVDILSLYSCSVQETTSEDKGMYFVYSVKLYNKLAQQYIYFSFLEYAQDSWNMLLRELICIHMPSSPQSTLNGLSLLSQLLPLPLPIEMPKVRIGVISYHAMLLANWYLRKIFASWTTGCFCR